MATTICSAQYVKMQYILGGKLKPVIKTINYQWKVANWIVEKFPEDYREMNYLEPFLGCGSVFIQKDPSQEEILNDPDEQIMNIWWAIRDEFSSFISKIKRKKYDKNTFEKMKIKNKKDDYLSLGIKEFLLRNMSKDGMKKTFIKSSDNLKTLESLKDRTKSSFMTCKDPVELLKSFDLKETFVYCNFLETHRDLEEDFNQEKNMEVCEILKNYKGKVVFLGKNSAFNKRIFTDWKRKGLPKNTKESVWLNF